MFSQLNLGSFEIQFGHIEGRLFALLCSFMIPWIQLSQLPVIVQGIGIFISAWESDFNVFARFKHPLYAAADFKLISSFFMELTTLVQRGFVAASIAQAASQ